MRVDTTPREIDRLVRAVAELQFWLGSRPDGDSHVVANALLNVATARLVAMEGSERAAGILARLAEAVRHGPAPEPARAVCLTALNS
jgi:hypothetical protein